MIVFATTTKKSLNLEGFLKHDIYYDIDADLFSKLKVLTEILQIEESILIDTLNYIKRLYSFPNASIPYRILFTIPVTTSIACIRNTCSSYHYMTIQTMTPASHA